MLRAVPLRFVCGAITRTSTPSIAASARRSACRPAAPIPSSFVSRTIIEESALASRVERGRFYGRPGATIRRCGSRSSSRPATAPARSRAASPRSRRSRRARAGRRRRRLARPRRARDGRRRGGDRPAAAGAAHPGSRPGGGAQPRARAARGEVVCFTDDDCEPEPGWAAALAAATGAGTAAGRTVTAPGAPAPGRRLAGDRRAPDARLARSRGRRPRLRPDLQPGGARRGARAAAVRRELSRCRRRGPRLVRPRGRRRPRSRLRPRRRRRPPPGARPRRIRPPAVSLRTRRGPLSAAPGRGPAPVRFYAGLLRPASPADRSSARSSSPRRSRSRSGSRSSAWRRGAADQRSGRRSSGRPASPSGLAPATSQTVAATSTSRGGRPGSASIARAGTTSAQASPGVWLPERPEPLPRRRTSPKRCERSSPRAVAARGAQRTTRSGRRSAWRARVELRRRGSPRSTAGAPSGSANVASPAAISSPSSSASRRIDDPVALAAAQVEPHVALVVGRVGEGARRVPVDARAARAAR